MNKLIEIKEQIEFAYQKDRQCVYCIPAGINIVSGKSYSIEGVSGSGKSTILTLLALLRRFHKGEIDYTFPEKKTVTVTNENWNKVAGPDFWGNIGFSFQKPEMIRALTVEKNLELALNKSDRTMEMILSLFEKKEWNEIKGLRVWNISGGQAQRVGIIRSFGINQPIVFMDEPTNNLDKSNRKKVTYFINKYRENRTIVFVSHDTDFLQRLNVSTIFRIFEESGIKGEKRRILGVKQIETQ